MDTLFLLVMMAALFLMLNRQKKKRLDAAQKLRDSAGPGAEVMTTSGIYGFVSAIEGDIMWLEIADDIEIRVARSAIAKVITPAAADQELPEIDSTTQAPSSTSVDDDAEKDS